MEWEEEEEERGVGRKDERSGEKRRKGGLRDRQTKTDGDRQREIEKEERGRKGRTERES